MLTDLFPIKRSLEGRKYPQERGLYFSTEQFISFRGAQHPHQNIVTDGEEGRAVLPHSCVLSSMCMKTPTNTLDVNEQCQ